MPRCFVMAGPNGSGKTTAALTVLPEIECLDYVNADAIAYALSPFQPEKVAIKAGRLLIESVEELASRQEDFAFETTLASRSFYRFLKTCQSNQYEITLIYMWLDSPELAIKRVENRVRQGGHNIPKADIIRRYTRSCQNLMHLYLPIADNWTIFNNSYEASMPSLIAEGDNTHTIVYDQSQWHLLLRSAQR